MFFFLLACSLWGALLLFRRSRYKGHAKYKYKYIIMAVRRGNMRVKGSAEKLKKKRLEKQKETGKAETGEEKCGERLGDCLEKEDGLTFEEKLSRGERDESEWHDEESPGQSQYAAGPFICRSW